SFRVDLPETFDGYSGKATLTPACPEYVDESRDCFLGFRPDNAESTSGHRTLVLSENRDEGGNRGWADLAEGFGCSVADVGLEEAVRPPRVLEGADERGDCCLGGLAHLPQGKRSHLADHVGLILQALDERCQRRSFQDVGDPLQGLCCQFVVRFFYSLHEAQTIGTEEAVLRQSLEDEGTTRLEFGGELREQAVALRQGAIRAVDVGAVLVQQTRPGPHRQ